MDHFSSPGFGSEFGSDDAYLVDDTVSADYVTTRYTGLDPNLNRRSERYVPSARQLLSARHKIAKIMPRNLFRDSAWDVMLELYIGTAENVDVYVKQAIIASGECPATAMRIIARLEQSGFLCRKDDESDQRRVVVSLSPKGMEVMEMLLENIVAGSTERSKQAARHYRF